MKQKCKNSKIDDLKECTLYPIGYKGSKVTNPFSQSGYLNGIQIIFFCPICTDSVGVYVFKKGI
jgi:hypothetical protein